MKIAAALCAFATASLCCRVPAAADDATEVRAKLGAAAADIASFQIRLRMQFPAGAAPAPLQADGTLTFVRPNSIKTTMTVGSFVIEAYAVDGFVYVELPDKTWRKASQANAMQTQPATAILQSIVNERITVLPDPNDNGAGTGMIGIELQLPPSPTLTVAAIPRAQHIRCSYDKATYRLRVCRTDVMTMTFRAYNDPANVVVLPPEAKDALPMPLGHPVPRHSPAIDSDTPSTAATPAPMPTPSPSPADAATAAPAGIPSTAPTPS